MIQRSLFRSLQSATRIPHHALLPITTSPFRILPVAASTSTRLLIRRSYSATADPADSQQSSSTETTNSHGPPSDNNNSSTTPAEPVPASKHEEVLKQLQAKEREVLDLQARLQRTVADYRNLQEQTRREVAAAREFALQRFAKDLLDSVDNLDRALATVPAEALADASEANKDLKDLHSGLKMTEEILLGTLKKHGMERFDPGAEEEGSPKRKFDPNTMEATFQAPQPDKEDGTVFYTQQKGFTYNGRVLRAAKVGVVKNS